MAAPTTESTLPGIAAPPKRADARRNYDALLVAARTAFDRDGTGASLEAIARDAGVAIGTLYRHFPNREWLIATLTQESLIRLTARAEELGRADDPADALRIFVDAAIAHACTFRGLAEQLSVSYHDERSPFFESCHRMHESSIALLRRAQEARVVRDDVSGDDLWTLILSSAWLRETSAPGEDRSLVVTRLALAGLRREPAVRDAV